MLVAIVFVLTAFVGMIPVAQAAVNTLKVSDLLKKLNVEQVGLPDGFQSKYDLFGLHPNERVLAMLKLSGDPVALIQAERADLKLSAAEKDAIKRDLKARQDALIPTIESLGGRVVGQYQVVYNGIKVEIPRS